MRSAGVIAGMTALPFLCHPEARLQESLRFAQGDMSRARLPTNPSSCAATKAGSPSSRSTARTRMNALSGELIDALQAEFDRLAKDKEIRCIVIEAKGRAFSSGHDLREVRSTDDYGFHFDLITRCSAMMMSIRPPCPSR